MMNLEHLTPEEIRALKNGLISREEAIGALAHIGECDRCAEVFAGICSETELLELPQAFKFAVLSAVEREDRAATSERKKAKEAGSRRELMRFSFRVSVAACITLFLLFSGTIDYGLNFSRSIHPDLSGVNVITKDLKGFSDKLVDFDLTKYIEGRD